MIHQIVLAFEEASGIISSKYYTGESLCNDIQNGCKFDLIILDIELKTTNGVKIGKMLREDFQRIPTQILYISGKKEYAMELFDTRPLNFLIKPLEPQKMHKCLRQAINLCDRSAPYFEYTLRKILHRVAYREIRYSDYAVETSDFGKSLKIGS